ncbi:MAG: sulfatase [Verrucomicrobia bacterium]|nr:sulfatase [Verrucomicrobiota bacterium]
MKRQNPRSKIQGPNTKTNGRPTIVLKFGFWILVLGVFASAVLTASAAASRPSIVFILTDDLGINDLACYGRTEHRTPNLDRLAAQGTRFTSAYCAQPICSPSRAAIMTGKAPARLHLTTYLPGRPDCVSQKLLHPVKRQQIPVEEKTLAEHFKAAGYATACIGKWHLGGKGFLPTDQGFDVYRPGKAVTKPSATEGGKGEYELTRWAEEFIETNRARPFFLYLAHDTPHLPYSARADVVERNARAFNPTYAAVIEAMDDAVGRLLATIDSLGIATNTIVIFTSDNGGVHMPEGPHNTITHNAPYRAGKGYLYEGGLRIPLIVRWPGKVPAGRVVDVPVINTDWLPTLLDCAGLARAAGIDGGSFRGLLLGKTAKGSRNLFWHFPHYNNQGGQPAGAMRDGEWKLIEHYEDGRLELFNLSRDIGETNNLALAEPRRAARMAKALARWRTEIGAQTNVANPNFDEAAYRSLYVDYVPSKENLAQTDDVGRARGWNGERR